MPEVALLHRAANRVADIALRAWLLAASQATVGLTILIRHVLYRLLASAGLRCQLFKLLESRFRGRKLVLFSFCLVCLLLCWRALLVRIDWCCRSWQALCVSSLPVGCISFGMRRTSLNCRFPASPNVMPFGRVGLICLDRFCPFLDAPTLAKLCSDPAVGCQ